MDSLKTAIEFIEQYPMWAKALIFGGIAIASATAAFAPRAAPPVASVVTPLATEAEVMQDIQLEISGITLFPDKPEAFIKLSCIVNGTTFLYPSLAGVSWLQIGPSMTHQLFSLPKSNIYSVRFEMILREGNGSEKHYASQDVVTIKSLPYSEKYSLYFVRQGVKEASVSAQVAFSLRAQK